MKHDHTTLLEQIYSQFGQRNFKEMLQLCAENITFQIAGKSVLAGKYDRSTFSSVFQTKMAEISQGTYKLDVHDILTSDRHGTVLATVHLSRQGEAFEYRTVHVWRFENGKPVAWYEYPRDLYQYDTIWRKSS